MNWLSDILEVCNKAFVQEQVNPQTRMHFGDKVLSNEINSLFHEVHRDNNFLVVEMNRRVRNDMFALAEARMKGEIPLIQMKEGV